MAARRRDAVCEEKEVERERSRRGVARWVWVCVLRVRVAGRVRRTRACLECMARRLREKWAFGAMREREPRPLQKHWPSSLQLASVNLPCPALDEVGDQLAY